MPRHERSISFWLAITLLGVAIQWWLVPQWPAETDDFAWWLWEPSPKPPGAWLDERQAAYAVYALAAPVVVALIVPLLIDSKHPRASRAIRRVTLALAAGLAVAGTAAMLSQQPRYLGGRLLFCGLLALWLAWDGLKHAPVDSAPPQATEHHRHESSVAHEGAPP